MKKVFAVFLEKLITRSWRILIPLVASCLLATACSSTRFGYDMVPWWLGWQLNRHLDLDDDQRELVRVRVDALHRWHRQTQLPAYTAFLADVQSRLHGPVGAGDIGRWRESVHAAWTPIAERVAPDVATLALTLQPRQLEQLARRFRESSREERRKLLPDDAERRQAARVERVLERVRFFVGDLPSQQEEEVRSLAAALPAIEPDWLAEREARQQAVLAVIGRIVRERPAPELAEAWCREMLDGLWSSADPGRREAIARSAAAGDALSATVLERSAPAQRERLHARLRGFVEDFSVLAAR